MDKTKIRKKVLKEKVEHYNNTSGRRSAPHESINMMTPIGFEKHLESKILKALFQSHIYEEVAYEITVLQNQHQNIGLGMIGELETEMDEQEFLQFVKHKMQADGIRHSQFLNKKIKKVAVLGGAGSFAISNAIIAGADIFLTSDLYLFRIKQFCF